MATAKKAAEASKRPPINAKDRMVLKNLVTTQLSDVTSKLEANPPTTADEILSFAESVQSLKALEQKL